MAVFDPYRNARFEARARAVDASIIEASLKPTKILVLCAGIGCRAHIAVDPAMRLSTVFCKECQGTAYAIEWPTDWR